jgi:hypothetical protein
MTSNSNPEASAESLRPKVPASERRKRQNRAAQKTYREKQKRRLQELERLAVSAGLVSQNGKDNDVNTRTTRKSTTMQEIPTTQEEDQSLMFDGDDFDLFGDPAFNTAALDEVIEVPRNLEPANTPWTSAGAIESILIARSTYYSSSSNQSPSNHLIIANETTQ